MMSKLPDPEDKHHQDAEERERDLGLVGQVGHHVADGPRVLELDKPHLVRHTGPLWHLRVWGRGHAGEGG